LTPAAVPSVNRIQSLEIVRGLALLGVFVVHFHHWTEPGGIAGG
jgi:peptidoglycan/LPS O-acetylase OafA/YrhL